MPHHHDHNGLREEERREEREEERREERREEREDEREDRREERRDEDRREGRREGHGGGYNAPQGVYNAPPPQGYGGYNAPPPQGYGGYGAPPPGQYGGGYGAPPQGYGAPNQGYGGPPQEDPNYQNAVHAEAERMEQERVANLRKMHHDQEGGQRNERIAEVGALAAGAFAMYEGYEARKDPAHAKQHMLEAEIAGAAAVAAGGYAVYEHHQVSTTETKIHQLDGTEEKKHGWF